MLISQSEACRRLRRDAGYAVEAARIAVMRLPQTRQGKRTKVRAADVQVLIDEVQTPTPATRSGSGSTRGRSPFRPEILRQI